MITKIVFPDIEINTTPLEEIVIDPYSITIYFDDIYGKRYKMVVQPYQAINIITIDCVSSRKYYNSFCYRDGRFHRHILHVEGSEYLSELRKSSKEKQLLDKSKHYALPFQDILVEFLAYEFRLECCD